MRRMGERHELDVELLRLAIVPDTGWAVEFLINDSDRHGFMTGEGTIMPILRISEFPLGVPVKGSRGRKPRWTDRRYAELVRDIHSA